MITDEDVKKIAFLSRLKVEPEKMAETKEEFAKILTFIGELNEVDTNNVEPLVSVNENNIICRDDVVVEANQRDAILVNAPEAKYGYFTVPKVVE